MSNPSQWDWEPGEKTVAKLSDWGQRFAFVEEPYASPDGERLAAVVRTEDQEYRVCINGDPWENTYERAWYPRFGPDGRLTAIVQNDMRWTLAVDGDSWEEDYDFVWNTQFSGDGSRIGVCVQADMRYGMALDGQAWESMYTNANHCLMHHDGTRSVAAVQVDDLGQADIETFQKGIFSTAIDGETWKQKFVNVWNPRFSADGEHVACEVRLDLYTYTIAVDGEAWEKKFLGVWEPAFNPATGAVTAPVRIAGKWKLATDGEVVWNKAYAQCWHQKYSHDGAVLAALCAASPGSWTMVVNGEEWSPRFLQLSPRWCFSADGKSIAVGGRTEQGWAMVRDGVVWNGRYPRMFNPVFDPTARHLAVRVEKDGKTGLLLDGKEVSETWDRLWDPAFSEDGSRILIRGLKNGAYVRRVTSVQNLL